MTATNSLPAGYHRYKLTLEYDGSPFCGWQRTSKTPQGKQSIEHRLRQAFYQFTQQTNLHLVASGRTDAGVHAIGQVIHIDLPNFPPETIRRAVNYHLREENGTNYIAVVNVQQVEPSFHARFHAIQRIYSYRIINRNFPLVLQKKAWLVPYPLNLQTLEQSCHLIQGKRDWSSFRASHCQSSSPLRTINSCTITAQNHEIIITISAPSFLYHQVRNIVGTLVEVGRGRLSLAQLQAIIEAADRTQAGPTAPPDGLCLQQVIYP